MSKKLIYYKGSMSELSNDIIKTKCISKSGRIGSVIVNNDVKNNVISYDLHVASDTEPSKLTTLFSSFWEMRKHAIEHHVRQIGIKKVDQLYGNLSWNDIEKCIIECFNNTKIKIIICEV